MSDTFFMPSNRTARKSYHCDDCARQINAGTQYHYQPGIVEGDLSVHRSHLECLAAWTAYADQYECGYDEVPCLCDIQWEADEKVWLHENHPVVADRLWRESTMSEESKR